MTKELSGAGQHSHVFSSSSIKAVLTHQYPGEGKDREGVCSGCKELQRAVEGPTISEIQKIWRLGSMETCTDWQVCLCSERQLANFPHAECTVIYFLASARLGQT